MISTSIVELEALLADDPTFEEHDEPMAGQLHRDPIDSLYYSLRDSTRQRCDGTRQRRVSARQNQSLDPMQPPGSLLNRKSPVCANYCSVNKTMTILNDRDSTD